ncbi:MAG TPA: helix-turn-helix transcriptional regulator [Sphingobium sp.]|uniref:helix-turn-helix transcriptional regulator n=1 Tax=Sphingobium sp. TaxID=1912891 RepID=UPI002ED1BFCD
MPLVNGQHCKILAELRSDLARVQLVQFTYPGPRRSEFYQDDCFWLDMCLTPRRVNDRARYIDHWVQHRSARMGAVVLLLPGERLALANDGGRRVSLICQIDLATVRALLPTPFEMTDHRLEACLDISSPEISWQMRRLAHEVRYHDLGWERICSAALEQLSIDLARYLVAVTEADERGSLATWRLRIIDRRACQPGPPPTLTEIADACNLSVRQLTRAFRLTRGCTIGEYLIQGRMETAKRRLATTENLKAIADSLGFSSQANFSTAFRRATGASPNEFRRRMLRGGDRASENTLKALD